DQTSAEIAEDIAVEVLAEDHIELRRILDDPHTSRIDDDLVVLNAAWILLVLFLGAANEKSVRELHDVRLVEHCHSLPASGARILEGKSRDSSTRLFGRDLQRRDYTFSNDVLDTGVEAFGV